MMHERASDTYKVFFKVPAKYKGQKPILFGKVEFEPINRESLENGSESP